MEKTNELLVVFDPIAADIARFAEENRLCVFDYEDPKGNALARSHCYKLRLVKGRIESARKAAKDSALKVCQAIDGKARELTGAIDQMIEVHDAPLREIEQRAAKAEEARLAEEAARLERIEAERVADLERREAEQRAAEAKLRAEREAFERVQREAKIKADAEAAAQARIIREREEAARQQEEAIAFERRKAQVAQERAQREAAAAVKAAEDKARREREEAERVAAEARLAEVRKREQEAKDKAKAEAEEAASVANKKHRAIVEEEASDDFKAAGVVLSTQEAKKITVAIADGKIRHVIINY